MGLVGLFRLDRFDGLLIAYFIAVFYVFFHWSFFDR